MFETLKEVLSQRSGLLGFLLLITLIALAIYAPIRYGKYYKYWRDIGYWSLYPKAVPPEWVNAFSSVKLPPSEFLRPTKVKESKLYSVAIQKTFEFDFDYSYDVSPSDIYLVLKANYSKPPVVVVYFVRPDGEKVKVLQASASSLQSVVSFDNSQEIKNSVYSWLVSKNLNVSSPSAIIPSNALFCKLGNGCWAKPKILKGRYKVIVQMIGLGNFTANPELVLAGRVYGLLGTAVFGRDLFVYVMLGLPYGLAVGV